MDWRQRKECGWEPTDHPGILRSTKKVRGTVVPTYICKFCGEWLMDYHPGDASYFTQATLCGKETCRTLASIDR